MRHWYFSVFVDSEWSAGWIEFSVQPTNQSPRTQSEKYQCLIDTAIFLLMMGTKLSEKCREEK